MSQVTVRELQRAWRAIREGQFVHPPSPSGRPPDAGVRWFPTGPVLPVLGAHSQAGASTVALALATCAAPARLVGCPPAPACGLAAAASAELGACGEGWLRGTRGDVVLERRGGSLPDSSHLPIPVEADRPVSLTVVDVGWDLARVLSGDGSWLSSLVWDASALVVTATVSVPSLMRLENVLGLLPEVCVAAVTGPPLKRWPKSVTSSTGPRTRRLLADGLVVAVPADGGLKVSGITAEPLPHSLLAAASELLRAVDSLTPTQKDLT